MSEKTSHPSVRDLEASFLRKGWWLFPLLGAWASLGLGDPFWQWVAGASPFSAGWQGLSILRSGGLTLAGLAVPAIWWVGLRMRRRPLLIALGVGLAILLVECGMRSSTVQGPLWLASRARLESGQSYMREVCYIRLEEASGRTGETPAIVLMGSSQVLHGMDQKRLGELLSPTPVIRRAMFGMSPLKALSMLAYVPLQPQDICIQYLSEFDFTNQNEFPYAWFRPYASWETLPDVLSCIPGPVQLRQWQGDVDYTVAATFECWRDRDFLRQIAFNFLCAKKGESAAVPPADPAAAVSKARGALVFSPSEEKAFTRFAQRLVASDVTLWVIEGDVNPAIYTDTRLEAKQLIRARMEEESTTTGFQYLSLQEQDLSLGSEHWLDMTHLNPSGRELLTRRIAQELMEK